MGIARSSGGRAAARLPSAEVRAVHELFVAGEVDASYLDSTPLRRVVAESWQRSLAKGVDPDRGGAQSSSVALSVARMRDVHPLASALPVIRRLLVSDAADSGVVVAITAADGTLLWVEGDPTACRKVEAMNFVPGADWSERGAGTIAPGTALALDRELQIRGSEHFSRLVQPWSCTAVPVHDLDTGALIGAIDLTGGSRVASAADVGAGSGNRRRGGEPPGPGRHADILVLLSRHPEGLSADHLAVLLDDKDLVVVTVRAGPAHICFSPPTGSSRR